MAGLLAGKVVIVTGSAQAGSIGEAIVRRVAEEGATAVMTSRNPKALEDAKTRLRGAGPAEVRGCPCDLTRDADAAQLVADTLRECGKIDGVVHNAGYPVTEWARSFMEVDVAEYARVFDVDVVGSIRLTKAVLPHMIERRNGSLIYTSSTAAIAGYEYLHEFAPAKGGLLALMRALAQEFGKHNVRSNAVAYGNIRSPATYDALTPEQQRQLALESPMQRWGEQREAANASVFLLSELASFVNGQTVVVDGGTVSR
jgi:NAD(P)-dependent dehydrogenase (short-subunit alcohol dehydrogenase family)